MIKLIGCIAALVMCACLSKQGDKAELKPLIAVRVKQQNSWKKQPMTAVPNIFGDKTSKRYLSHGYYKQAGSVASNAEWESVAHYSYIGYKGANLGKADKYAISPTGRYVVLCEGVPKTSNAKLKIYDKKAHSYCEIKIKSSYLTNIVWALNEKTIDLEFGNNKGERVIKVPTPTNQ